MPAEDVFENEFFASLYDCFNAWSECDEFYFDQAVTAGGPVLDLGCGTGALACGLALNGLDVVGVDPSEAMLRTARSRDGGEKVVWMRSDAQSLHLAHRFNFICMTGHAFQQLLTDADALALFRTVAHHLKPHGRFIFETRNPAAQAWLSWTPQHPRPVVQSPEHGRVSLIYDAVFDPASGIVTITEHYRLLDQGAQRTGRNRIRFVSREHLADLLAEAGLAVVEWYGDWDGQSFSPTSREIIALTRRTS